MHLFEGEATPPEVQLVEESMWSASYGTRRLYRVLDLHSARLVPTRPLLVEILQTTDDGVIGWLCQTHVCGFGASLDEALRDIRSTLEERFQKVQAALRDGRDLSGAELEDGVAFGFLVRER